MDNPKRVLILMSDTGGGHRAAAEAIRDALVRLHGDAVAVEMVDVFREYTPIPFKYAPELYPWWIKNGKLMWRMGYNMSNRPGRVKLIIGSVGRAIFRGVRRMLVREHDSDVIVCVHPLFPTAALSVLRNQPTRPPFVTVITDLVSTHAFWYERRADRILMPTQPAYDYGLELGVPAEKMRITGLPVNPRFAEELISKEEARQRLGWDMNLPAILLIGGGAGMGPMFRIAKRINRLHARCQLIIVAGRNATLRERLEAQAWNQPTKIYSFVTNMPELMAAADLLVTKAGPATISEACIAGLPMILSDAIPGQEDGNVTYVTAHQAGVYAPGPAKVARAVNQWLSEGPEFLHQCAENARQLARPDAVWQIADEIWHFANQPRITQTPARRRQALRWRRSGERPRRFRRVAK